MGAADHDGAGRQAAAGPARRRSARRTLSAEASRSGSVAVATDSGMSWRTDALVMTYGAVTYRSAGAWAVHERKPAIRAIQSQPL